MPEASHHAKALLNDPGRRCCLQEEAPFLVLSLFKDVCIVQFQRQRISSEVTKVTAAALNCLCRIVISINWDIIERFCKAEVIVLVFLSNLCYALEGKMKSILTSLTVC